MDIKAKFAAILRRWASKLSPENNNLLPGFGLNLPSPTGVAYYNIRRVASAFEVSPREEREAHRLEQYGYHDAVKRMREEYKERVAHAIVAALWEKGIVEYSEEHDPVTRQLRISGSLYVGIRDNIDNTNPFNE